MKIYTRTGDDGRTALFGGGRVSKASTRVAAYGTVDELNAVVGWTVTQVRDPGIASRLTTLQHDLFVLGSHLATPAADAPAARRLPPLPTARVEEMERWMDDAEGELPPLRAFVLPGGSVGGAALHWARTVCRRAERHVVALREVDEVDEGILRYLNRLSDLLFVLARLENHRAGIHDVEWEKDGG